jgi:hypothetical protein
MSDVTNGEQTSAIFLPQELWFYIFSLLDIPDLLVCSRVCGEWRQRALDPFLHKFRLLQTAKWLEGEYGARPNSKELAERQILLSARHLSPEPFQKYIQLTLLLSRTLKRDAVRRGLESRPSFEELLQRGVIKRGGNFAHVMTSIEKQRVIDILKGFFSGSSRPTLEMAIRRGIVPKEEDNTRKPVHTLTRMFSYWSSQCGETISRSRDIRPPPPRAKVYKMRQQFESIISGNSAMSHAPSCRAGTPLYNGPSSIVSSPNVERRQLRRQLTGISQGAVSMLRQRFSVSVSVS